MAAETLSVRHLQKADIPKIVDYFLGATPEHLLKMGVDVAKLPRRGEWLDIMYDNFELGVKDKQFFYIIWLLNNRPAGHSNINKIIFGKEAYMHLHIWQDVLRRKGIGQTFLKMTLPLYFNTYKLQNVFCEPSALNPAPNKTLEKIGFDFIRSYETTPGWINSFQKVNRWCLTKEKFDSLFGRGIDRNT